MDSGKLDRRLMERIEYSLSVWNSARLTERHRKAMKCGYIPVYDSRHIPNRGYQAVGDTEHIRPIQEHARHCMAVFRTVPTKNRACFIIGSRPTGMHSKLADCRGISMHPGCFPWNKECKDYYPGLFKDIAEYVRGTVLRILIGARQS